MPASNSNQTESEITLGKEEWEISISYKCSICSVYVSKANELVSHIIEVHCGNYFYFCHICKNFKSQEHFELVEHLKRRHGLKNNKVVSCPLCFLYSSDSEDEVRDHITRAHWEIKALQRCKICSFKCEGNIGDHIKNDHKGFRCLFRNCRPKLDGALSLFGHILTSHIPSLELSYESNFTFPNKKELLQHLRDYRNASRRSEFTLLISCNLCSNYRTQVRQDYLNHLDSKHPWYRLKCPFKLCTYFSKRFWGFTQHVIYNHLVLLKFLCPLCGKDFFTLKSGKDHSFNEHNKNIFLTKHVTCKICNSELDSQAILEHLHEFHDLYIPPEIDMLFWKNVNEDEYESIEYDGDEFHQNDIKGCDQHNDREMIYHYDRATLHNQDSQNEHECCNIL